MKTSSSFFKIMNSPLNMNSTMCSSSNYTSDSTKRLLVDSMYNIKKNQTIKEHKSTRRKIIMSIKKEKINNIYFNLLKENLFSNLKIVERHQHSQRVSYVPLGRDAAIYWPSQDLQFKNDTNYPIKIKMVVKDGVISCTFLTCQNVKPKKVKVTVSRSGKNFTMKRYAGGKCNYTTRSYY